MERRRGEAETIDAELPNYRLGKILGIGSFSKVKVANHALTGNVVAVKIVSRQKLRNMDLEENARREIEILKLLQHPHVIQFCEVVEAHANIYIVMEHAESGELFDHLVEKGRLQECEARHFFQQIISGVEHCHRNMVIHRDLRLENLLLDSKYNIKIIDFGMSNTFWDGQLPRTNFLNPYSAPELISRKPHNGPEVDVWSCGVILYALICGHLPFMDENIPNLHKKIRGGIYDLPENVSDGARYLILRMLEIDPTKRITIAEIRQHPWFQ
ncbi:SNF1-related protein kinase catalytic subunit alpha KIN10, partial [Ananas comosus]